ncbi:MAG: cell division protein ZapA [Bacteroidetes bacterium]|nr:cell division protein ZapA [Bacteroidota bacterium]
MEETLIAVNILVGDRNYRLKVKPSDEEQLRKTIKLVNSKLLEFKTHFAGKDMQDYIAMVLIWLATEQPVSVLANEDYKELNQKIKSIEQLITENL